MAEIITETLLEMHFHRAIVDYFKNMYGANFLRLLKPSTQQEAWIGFDQAWTFTSLTTSELFDQLKQAISTQSYSISNFYFGYFLQFKPVQRIERQSRNMPDTYNTPYLRSVLSVKPNKTTGFSQHETLLRVLNINNAVAAYACAMLFSLEDIYKEANVDDIHCIDLTTSPKGWATNESHFITFKNEFDLNPLWCSDPSEGRSFNFRDWAAPDSRIGPKKLSADQILTLLRDTVHEFETDSLNTRGHYMFHDFDILSTRIIPESFTLLEFSQ